MLEPPLLIDVRSKFEYGMFHAPAARNLSLPRLIMGMIPGLEPLDDLLWFQDLSKDESVAVICLTSHLSPIAVSICSKLVLLESSILAVECTSGDNYFLAVKA